MVSKQDSNLARQKRHARVRGKISGTAERPRLNVYRSLNHIYAQLIDDGKGVTLATASSVEKDFGMNGGNKEAAKKVGELIAEGNVPKEYAKFGSTVPEIFADLRELRSIYGDEADSFPTGAIGVFSYLNKIHLGVRQFLALNRKFDVAYTDRTDLIPLTYEALDLLNGTYLK